MTETVAEYAARIASFVEGKDALPVLRETPSNLADLILEVPEETLTREPSPGKWSVCQVLAHLADAEIVSTWRYRQIVEHDGVAIAAFDQNVWARVGDYRTAASMDSLELFRLLRENNLRMFARLSPEEWKHFGVHAERGRMTLEDLVRQMAGHDLNHLEQVRQAVGAR